jgi:translation initiation factor IF-2
MRLSKIAKELNISITRLAEFLDSKGHAIDVRPTTKISQEQYDILLQEFNKDFYEKQQSSEAIELKKQEKEEVELKRQEKEEVELKSQEKEEVIEEKVDNINLTDSDKPADPPELEKEILKDESKIVKNINENKNKELSNESSDKKNPNDSENKIEKVDSKNTLKGPVLTGETIDLSLFEKNKKKKQNLDRN